ncbi:response regulator [Streptomyces sp. NPDC050428]|uniref:response regulator n=1 Tax=Streptomyces sp. NPDC050428 TaxID=3155757 RepID=UPI00341AD901
MTEVAPPCPAALKTYSVLVVDPEASARTALATAIGAAPGLELAGEAANGEETVARAVETGPDVVLMGTGVSGMNIMIVTRRLMDATDRPPKVVILTAPDQRERYRDALQAGATGLLLRDAPHEQLLGAIAAVAAGYTVMAPAFVAELTERDRRGNPPPAFDVSPVAPRTPPPGPRRDWWGKTAIKVVLAKEEALTREALTGLLQLTGDIEVVAGTGRGGGVPALIDEHRAGLAVLDVHLPGMNGIEVAEQLHRERPGFPVVLLTCGARPGHLHRAFKAGVRGILTSETSVNELSRVIREVHAGGRHCPPELVTEVLAVGENPLTAREAEILKAAEDGRPLTVIASQLHLSPGTVRNHIHSAIHKLKAGNRISAVHAASRAGWI